MEEMEQQQGGFVYETLAPLIAGGGVEEEEESSHALLSLAAPGLLLRPDSPPFRLSRPAPAASLVYRRTIGCGPQNGSSVDEPSPSSPEAEAEEEEEEDVLAMYDDSGKESEMNSELEENSEEEEIEYFALNLEGLDKESAQEAGISFVAPDKPASLLNELPPWCKGEDASRYLRRSPLLQLHQEIVDFCDFVSPTEEEQQVRQAAVQRVSSVVKSIWPKCQVKVFGSFATGLYLPTSDIDMVILDSGCSDIQLGLKALAKALAKESISKNMQVIARARVPIVKFVEKESCVSIDISFNVANGPQAATFIKEAMAALPPLKPLCLVLKIFLQQRELNEVYTGGIGSYQLIVMILTHLQMHRSRLNYNGVFEPSKLERNLGVLLVDFLELYGRTLNFKDVGVSCRKGGSFYRKSSRGFSDSKRPNLLSVEDPQAPENDIGKNSYNFIQVRNAFFGAYKLLTVADPDKAVGQPSLLGRMVWLDEKLVQRKALLEPLKGLVLAPRSQEDRWEVGQEESGSPRMGGEGVESAILKKKDSESQKRGKKRRAKGKESASSEENNGKHLKPNKHRMKKQHMEDTPHRRNHHKAVSNNKRRHFERSRDVGQGVVTTPVYQRNNHAHATDGFMPRGGYSRGLERHNGPYWSEPRAQRPYDFALVQGGSRPPVAGYRGGWLPSTPSNSARRVFTTPHHRRVTYF